MATIESTTNLVDNNAFNNIKEEKVDRFFDVAKSSDHLDQEEDEKIVQNQNIINGSKPSKKDENQNSLANSPILSLSDMDTDNEEKTPQMRENLVMNKNTPTSSNSPIQTRPSRPISAPKNKVKFDRLSPTTFITNTNHYSYNDTINSTSSFSKGQVLFLNKAETTGNSASSSVSTSPVKPQNPIVNQVIPMTTIETLNPETRIERRNPSNTIKNLENSDEENPPDDSSKLIDESVKKNKKSILKNSKTHIKKSRSFSLKYNQNDQSVEFVLKNDCGKQITSPSFYQALIAELIGTCVLVIYATSFGLPIADKYHESIPSINGALGSGFTLATIIWCIGHVSGANLNPAVTIALLVTGDMNIIRAIAYIGSQLCGALLGAFIVQELVPEHMKGILVETKSAVLNTNSTISRIARSLGQNSINTTLINKTAKSILTIVPASTTSTASTAAVLATETITNNATAILKANILSEPYKLGLTLLNKNLTLSQGVGVEIIITFILMLTIFACLDSQRKDLGGSFPLTIGFAVAIGCFFGGPFTGGSMNPARSFGPAALANNFENHWIYWIGPITGSVIAAIVYKMLTFKITKHRAKY